MGECRLAEVRDTAIGADDVLSVLDDADAGGLAVFIGRVRDHDGGRGVTGLEYSAHPTAVARLREVGGTIAERYDAAVAVVHRVGELDIGDNAVVCAASSAHRGTAFEACRALIDTLKQEVPIWKHQRFADGTEEWVGTP